MDVLLVQPNAYPKKISVGTELEDLQAMVGGDIEVTYPFEDEVAIILNESGKINGLPLNLSLIHILCEVMNEIKKDELDHVTIKNEVLRKYFPKSYTPKQMQDTIIRLLEKWQRSKQRDMER